MSEKMPIASLSLDLDDEWTYLKTHGDQNWNKYPSYLNYAVPRILDFLEDQKVKITFFIVAQDAVFESNHKVLRSLAERGHDIGNHSFHHDPWLHTYSEEDVQKELERAEYEIEKVTGVKPTGFRGPGFSFSKTVLKVLNDKNYKYDASTFPNLLNPLARAYFLWKSNLSKEEREQRKGLFGSWKDGFRPNKPYKWLSDNGSELLEIPVTTMPLFKIPIHASYILFLSTYSVSIAMFYLRFSLFLSKITGTNPSILLHPLDFIGSDDTSSLNFFPAMRVPSQHKLKVMEKVFKILKKNYRLTTMDQHSDLVLNKKRIRFKKI